MRRRTRIALAGAFVVLFLLPMAVTLPDRTLAIVTIAVLVLAVFGLVLDAVRSTDEGSGSSWDLIPRWQYEGRHVEMGGATRSEQERAIEEIQEAAEEREGSSS
jgi:hypothetical protein